VTNPNTQLQQWQKTTKLTEQKKKEERSRTNIFLEAASSFPLAVYSIIMKKLGGTGTCELRIRVNQKAFLFISDVQVHKERPQENDYCRNAIDQ
jgi:hypothetical protein